MRLGQEFTAYAGAIGRAKNAIRAASELLRELGLGGSAVGTGINTHPDYRGKPLPTCRASPDRNSRQWTTCAMPCSRTLPWRVIGTA